MTHNFDSIIFDMDGTLWDAVPTYTKAWNQYLQEAGFDYSINPEFLQSFMGFEEKQFLSKMLPTIDEKNLSEVYNNNIVPFIYSYASREGGTLYTGVENGLKVLSKHYKLFIVSNCPEKLIDYFIRWAGFENIITDSIAHGQNFKSKYENIIILKEKHNLISPVYVGDTESDQIQSQKAGVPFYYMNYGFGECEKYSKQFSDFNKLVEFMLNR